MKEKKEPEMRKILRDAESIICGDRQAQYGSPEENWGLTARWWSDYLGFKVTPEQATVCMTLAKIAREKFKHKRDNLEDGIGYLAISSQLQGGK